MTDDRSPKEFLARLREQQTTSGLATKPKSQRIVVDRGQLRLVDRNAQAESFSELPVGRWAAQDAARLAYECAVAEQRFPDGAWREAVGDIEGWYYGFTSPQGDEYLMFTCFDGSLYRVHMVRPEPTRAASANVNHLFRENGLLCLNAEHGYRRLEEAFARSVAFGAAFSEFERTGRWPL